MELVWLNFTKKVAYHTIAVIHHYFLAQFTKYFTFSLILNTNFCPMPSAICPTMLNKYAQSCNIA